jgi:hypothetical protein
VLLAEELLVLRMGPKLEGRIDDSVETGLVAAIVCELIFAERLVVERQQHIDDDALRVIDSRPLTMTCSTMSCCCLAAARRTPPASWHSIQTVEPRASAARLATHPGPRAGDRGGPAVLVVGRVEARLA